MGTTFIRVSKGPYLCYNFAMKYIIPLPLSELGNIFSNHGYSLYLVGGAIRDFVMGKENSDYDLTTNAEPLEIKSMFKTTIDTGLKHGTVTVRFKGVSYEITTFRSDGDYLDNRHPESVKFIKNLSEDLKRRDFTINALCCNLNDGEIIDEHDGFKDLEKHIIRAIGNPEERFKEDALRMLRGCRFASKLDFTMEEETEKAIKTLHANISNISEERIKVEFFGLIDGKAPLRALDIMSRTGLLKEICPELDKARYEILWGKEETLYSHLTKTLSFCNNAPILVKVAALFHDIGKTCKWREGETHAAASARITDNILLRLKCSNKERETVYTLIFNHMFSYSSSWLDGDVRHFINDIGPDTLPLLFALKEADTLSNGYTPSLSELKERIDKELESNNPRSLKDLAIKGDDLIDIVEAKKIGKILSLLLSDVLYSPSHNNKEYLISKAKELNLGL